MSETEYVERLLTRLSREHSFDCSLSKMVTKGGKVTYYVEIIDCSNKACFATNHLGELYDYLLGFLQGCALMDKKEV